jgi:hypothetical protein
LCRSAAKIGPAGPITFHLALAVVLGTFFTFALGGGLFALSFFSARSGFDSDAAKRQDEDGPTDG